jgi:hypothetical protein
VEQYQLLQKIHCLAKNIATGNQQSIKTNFHKNSLPHSSSIDNLCPLGKNPKFNPKAVNQKLDDVSGKLATILCINKVHFAKMTDLMEPKFGTFGGYFQTTHSHGLQQLTHTWGSSP